MALRTAFSILVLAAGIGTPAAAQDMRWASGVREDGWGDGSVTASGDMVIFRRPGGTGPEGNPRLQLRYEYRDGQKMSGKSWLSMLALDEYDCKGGRFRNLKLAVFAGHNAEGASVQPPATVDPWAKPAPGTVDAKSLAVACGR